jgi:hypothetical protein
MLQSGKGMKKELHLSGDSIIIRTNRTALFLPPPYVTDDRQQEK